uniref:Uncharacterized protein n=1 Tax=Rhizophora mucronata TaxID=61149 RepID=A0A2P2N0V3_RHIMU
MNQAKAAFLSVSSSWLLKVVLCTFSYSYRQAALQLQLCLFHSWCGWICFLWILFNGTVTRGIAKLPVGIPIHLAAKY